MKETKRYHEPATQDEVRRSEAQDLQSSQTLQAWALPGRTGRASTSLLALQRSLGNRRVSRLRQGARDAGMGHSGPAGRVFRQAEPDPAAAADESEATTVNASQLGQEGEMPGHGNLGGTGGGIVPAVQAQGGAGGGVAVDVSMKANAPSEISKPAASIASAHGKPNVAGWCTPKYNIAVPAVSRNSIDVDVTLDFDIELASEYKGQVLNVLRDHEFGHVDIGKEKGQQHLVTDLKNGLQAFPAFTLGPPIQTQIVNAGNRFVAQEGTASQAYDNMDYPRMAQAYLGARLPLAKLMADSAKTATMVRALRSFTPAWSDWDKVTAPAQAALDARDALSEDELARLQYNSEFKALVEGCKQRIDAYVESHHWDLWVFEFSTLSQATRNKMKELSTMLGAFTWAPPA